MLGEPATSRWRSPRRRPTPVLHAYRDGSAGKMRVVACARADGLVVVVRDYGAGCSRIRTRRGSGLGLSVIGAVAHEVNIERPDDGGTRIRIHFRV
jgi:two-component sensor histidine kinase